MTNIDASMLDFRQLNAAIRDCAGDAAVTGCSGQRFIGAGLERGKLILSGTPGNALGAYLNGARIEVCGNAQDAVGDTMNAGRIVVPGIHMKAYGDKLPVMVIGGKAGSFLGEYQAGGVIVVLGLTESTRPIVSNFPCTGMHGGKLFLRSDCKNILLPKQVIARPASYKDLDGIWTYLHTFCELFGSDCDKLVQQPFTLITPNSSNPYKQLYVTN